MCGNPWGGDPPRVSMEPVTDHNVCDDGTGPR